MLNAYRGAEKFISAPVDQRLVIPGEKAEKAEWDNFYAKLGRPAAPRRLAALARQAGIDARRSALVEGRRALARNLQIAITELEALTGDESAITAKRDSIYERTRAQLLAFKALSDATKTPAADTQGGKSQPKADTKSAATPNLNTLTEEERQYPFILAKILEEKP